MKNRTEKINIYFGYGEALNSFLGRMGCSSLIFYSLLSSLSHELHSFFGDIDSTIRVLSSRTVVHSPAELAAVRPWHYAKILSTGEHNRGIISLVKNAVCVF